MWHELIPTIAAVALVVLLLTITRATQGREIRLQGHTAFAETLWDVLPHPAFLLDASGRIRRLNQAAEQLFHLKNNELNGTTLAELIEVERHSEKSHSSQDVSRMLSLGGVATCRSKGPDGESFPLTLRTRRISFNSEEWLLGTAHDATGEDRVKSALQRHLRQLSITKDALQRQNVDLEAVVVEQTTRLVEAKESAEKANAAKSVFLANVSHELRTPLHAILSFARFGTRRFDTVEREKLLTYFERIETSGTTLLNLLNSLLDLSKLESGAVELHRAPMNVASLVSDVADELSGIAHDKSIELKVHADVDTATCSVDAEKFAQVVRNLIGNSLKFTPAHGSITVSLATHDDSLLIDIRDTGPGIPDDECEAVFSKFVQSSKTQSGAGGTGLGLTISREIIRLHDGTLVARPTQGNGAHLQIRIPLATEFDVRSESSEDVVDIRTTHVLLT